MADLRPEDRRLFSEALVPQPARPSVMNQRKLHSRRARGSTATPSPRRTVLAAYKHTQYPCMIVPRPLRANYVRSRFLMTPAGGGRKARGPQHGARYPGVIATHTP